MSVVETGIYGNEKLIGFFESAVYNGKLAHAYIIEGGRGSGKHTLTRHLACLIACSGFGERPCLVCESCRKISSGISPDVITVGLIKDKKTIGVEQIRELRASVYIKPTEENVKIYVIENAECMTTQAQNVFLKVLEEPPVGVYFFMLCENASNILATVKSRAPILKMQIFTDEELSRFLLANFEKAKKINMADPEEFKLTVRISEGKIGEVLRLLEEKSGIKDHSRHEKAKKLIELLSNKSSMSDLLLYIQKFATTRDELSDIILYSLYAIRDLMVIKRDSADSGLLFYEKNEYSEKIASGFTSLGVVMIYDELCRARDELSMNVNVGTTLTYLAFKLKEAASL